MNQLELSRALTNGTRLNELTQMKHEVLSVCRSWGHQLNDPVKGFSKNSPQIGSVCGLNMANT